MLRVISLDNKGHRSAIGAQFKAAWAAKLNTSRFPTRGFLGFLLLSAMQTLVFAQDNPVPRLTSISPERIKAGHGNLSLTVTGNSFVPTSTVYWNGASRRTRFFATNTLEVSIDFTDLVVAGTANVVVENPPPGGGTSNALTFTIEIDPDDGEPTLTSISPSSVGTGSPSIALTVEGVNFTNGATAEWNLDRLETSFIDTTRLVASIPSSKLASPGSASITVTNPGVDGGRSNGRAVSIGGPIITRTSPASIQVGSPAQKLVVEGRNFLPGSTILWNESPVLTTFINDTTLSSFIQPEIISLAGTTHLTVMNPNGATSSRYNFSVSTLPVPVIAALVPSSYSLGDPQFRLRVHGAHFTPESTIFFNGTSASTVYVSDTELMLPGLTNPANLGLGEGHQDEIAVRNSGGAKSNSLLLTANNPMPILKALSPGSARAGAPPFKIAAVASNLSRRSILLWDGVPRSVPNFNLTGPVGFVEATIPSRDFLTPKTVAIAAANPYPGGGVSNSLPLAIVPSFVPVPFFGGFRPIFMGFRPNSHWLPVGTGPTNVEITGTDFAPGALLLLDGSPRSTTFSSSTLLIASLPESDLIEGKPFQLQVRNPSGAVSEAHELLVYDPVPVLSSVSGSPSPNSDTVEVIVNGSNFLRNSSIRADGVSFPTIFVNPGQLTATLPLSQAYDGDTRIDVRSPYARPQDNSPSLVFSLAPNSGPVIRLIHPPKLVAGTSDFTLTVNGRNFIPRSQVSAGSRVHWNGSQRPTEYANGQLEALISSADIAVPGRVEITVVQPSGEVSNAFPFMIVDAPASPQLDSLEPSSIETGGPAFFLYVNGSNFINGSTIQWNGESRSTVFIDPTRIMASIPKTDSVLGGLAAITVMTPNAARMSDPLNFFVGSPSLPPTVNEGGTVNAASFTPGAPLTPGSIASLFGTNLALSTDSARALPLPLTLAGTNVLIGSSVAPLFHASPLQVNFQVPWEAVLGNSQIAVQVTGQPSPPMTLNLVPFSPGIFTLSSQGTGQAAATASSTGEIVAPVGSVIGRSSRPAVRGEFITFFCTGLGDVSNTPPTGAAALSDPLSHSSTTPVVTLGGAEALVSFSGLAPGFAGLYQVDIRVPSNAPSGTAVPVVLTIGGVASNVVTIAVQ